MVKIKQYNVGVPFERIANNVAAPLSKTTSNNIYILVAMDYFSKLSDACAIPNQKTSTVASVLVNNLVYRFEVPLENSATWCVL